MSISLGVGQEQSASIGQETDKLCWDLVRQRLDANRLLSGMNMAIWEVNKSQRPYRAYHRAALPWL
jgi:hypothetical protein